MTEGYVAGIDGGGTKTRCLIADETGRVLGEGMAGPSNYQVVGLAGAAASLSDAVTQALAAAGVEPGALAGVCAGLAGVGRPEDKAAMTGALAFLAPARVLVVEDARIALAGALAGGPGAVVIAGTGSIAYGIDGAGQTVRAGGWGWVLGDEGSGFDIGRRALAAALAAQDGTGPATRLGQLICAAWELERLDQLVRRVYADVAAARPAIAGLVPVVVAAAESGDAVAAAILEQAGRELGGLAAAVLRRLDLPPGVPPVAAVTGGVLAGVSAVRDAMGGALTGLIPGAVLTDPLESPAEGALRLALALGSTGNSL